MVMDEASWVMVASCPSPPPGPVAAGLGTSVHFPVKFGVCAEATVASRIAPSAVVRRASLISRAPWRSGVTQVGRFYRFEAVDGTGERSSGGDGGTGSKQEQRS